MQQSALDPAGRAAERIADLFWAMTIGSLIIWAAVVALALYAMRASRKPARVETGRALIVGGGVIAPTVVLGGLLAYGLSMLPPLLARAPDGAIQIQVIGYQWWWRVRYLRDGRAPIELANELHLPVNAAAELQLESHDVIHAFWVPSLAGKVDMIPGRRTRLVLEPTRAGVFRGVCAEYCGASHALMSLHVVVESRAELDRWLERQASARAQPTEPLAQRGGELFLEHGCGACHTVRGTPAAGAIGPDLTHLGSRRAIGAGALGSDAASIRTFLARTAEHKPGVHMPAFGMLPAHDLDALSAYLKEGSP